MLHHRYCDGVKRRDFLTLGALAGLGLSMPGFLRLAKAGGVSSAKPMGRAASAIYIRLGGGPSHMDTFDLKPDAPDTHRGEFRPIATNVPGVEICEHLPRLARVADKFCVLRGVSHTLAAHELGSMYMATGNRPLPSLKFPSYGAVLSKERPSDPQLPNFVSVGGDNYATTAGYLGVAYSAFSAPSPKVGGKGEPRGLALAGGLTLSDIDRRHHLLEQFDGAFAAAGEDKLVQGLDEFGQRAYSMLRSPRARAAFDVSKEPASARAMFPAENGFAQGCLLAVRLVESGVPFITIGTGGWDTHQDNFTSLKTRLLPSLDAGLAGLLNLLDAKGLLESTAVFVTGEFGRTPKINKNAGRDHYPRAMFCLLAGGGVRGGQVIGESDAKGEGPKNEAITPDDVAASFYAALGIDATREYHTPTGRPVMIVRGGKPIRGLLA